MKLIMEPGDSIRRVGFKRWYERQLIEGHVYLVTALLAALLAALLMAVCVEDFGFNAPFEKVFRLLAIIFTAGLIAYFGARRFTLMPSLISPRKPGAPQRSPRRAASAGRTRTFPDPLTAATPPWHQTP